MNDKDFQVGLPKVPEKEGFFNEEVPGLRVVYLPVPDSVRVKLLPGEPFYRCAPEADEEFVGPVANGG